MRRASVFVAALAVAFVSAAHGSSDTSDRRALVAAEKLEILVLSNRADLISGGDALVEIAGADSSSSTQGVRVDIDGRDVTGSFAVRGDGRLLGLVEGLTLGENVLTAREPDATEARITITNHPIGGPVISGPQVQPWLCTTQNNGLGAAQDAQCNAPTVYQFFYRTTDGAFAAYNPANPPSNVAMTTTDQGKTVPYIFRQETGTQNRGIYRIAVLTDPTKPWEPWSPQIQPGWNHKLFYPFGASCGTSHSQSSAQNVQNHTALSRGFMVATSSLNVLGNNCNTLTSAEAVLMLKERIAERYGAIRYAFGSGGSGGSIGQMEIANAYPGLLQGLLLQISYEDMWSGALVEVDDCNLLLNYYTTPGNVPFDAVQQGKVNGHESASSCAAWDALFGSFQDPENGSGLPTNQTYNAETRPAGVRGTFQDFSVSIFGRRPPELWTPPEQAAGFGFAKLPYDNVGVQYGLDALQAGVITTEQFVALNERVGGVDVDHNFIPQRSVADPGAVEIAFRSSRANDTRQLDQVAIIDERWAVNAEIHTAVHSWARKQRLENANGHSDNHVIWTNGAPPAGSFVVMDRWLASIEADTSSDPLEAKIVSNKPAEAVNACFVNGQMITDEAQCRAIYPVYGMPRIAADGPLTASLVLKCQLKPLNRLDYGLVPFIDSQWARLQAAFPGGVCDWTKPSVDQVPSVPWLTYSNGPGGQPLGSPPVSTRAPDAVDDTAMVERGGTVVVDVLANDTDADGDALEVTGFTNGAYGTVSKNADGSLTYAQDGGPTSSDSFTYTVSDGRGGSDTATVAVTVTGPDLVITDLVATQGRGDRNNVTASVRNAGSSAAPATATEFVLDGTTVIGTAATPALAPGETANVTVQWITEGVNGEHQITATADKGAAAAETNESNNSASRTVTVKGNKIQNGSFEQSSSGSAPDNWTSSGETSYQQGGSDGGHSASAGPSGSWQSDPVAVEPGSSYAFSVDVTGTAGVATIEQLSATGTVLASLPLLFAASPLGAYETVAATLTVVGGASQVRVRLAGSLTGTATFDNVQLSQQ